MTKFSINEKMIISKYLNNCVDFFNFTNKFTDFYFTTFNCININIDYIPSKYIIHKLCNELIKKYINLNEIVLNIILPSPYISLYVFSKLKYLYNEFSIINKNILIKCNYDDIYIGTDISYKLNKDFIKYHFIYKTLNIVSYEYNNLVQYYNEIDDKEFLNTCNFIYDDDNIEIIKNIFNNNKLPNFYVINDLYNYKFKSFNEIKDNCICCNGDVIYPYKIYLQKQLSNIKKFPILYEIFKLRSILDLNILGEIFDNEYLIDIDFIIRDITSLVFPSVWIPINYIDKLYKLLKLIQYNCIPKNKNIKPVYLMNKLKCIDEISIDEIQFIFNYKKYKGLYFDIQNLNKELLTRIKYFI
jgi:hypothetical protein